MWKDWAPQIGQIFFKQCKDIWKEIESRIFCFNRSGSKVVSQWSDCGVHIINLYMLHISCTGVAFRLLSSKCHCFISFLKNSYGICSKFTIKTQEGRHWGPSGVFIVNFEQVHTLICFHSWLWKRKCWLYSFLSFEVFQRVWWRVGEILFERNVCSAKKLFYWTRRFFSPFHYQISKSEVYLLSNFIASSTNSIISFQHLNAGNRDEGSKINLYDESS